MSEFEKQGQKIQTFTAESIEEEYRTLLNRHHMIFSDHIIDIIKDEIKGIQEHTINDWIDEVLIEEIRVSGNRITNKLYDSLMNNFQELSKSINNPRYFIEAYEEEINKITRNINDYWLEDAIEEFRSFVIRRLRYYCDPFYEISTQDIDRKIEEINYNLRQKLRQLSLKFMEEYQDMLKHELGKNIDKIKNISEMMNQSEMTQEEFKEFEKYLKYSNFELIKEEEHLYVINLEENKKIALIYDPQNKILNGIENKLGFQIKDKEFRSVDCENDKVIIINDFSFQTCKMNFENHMAIVEKIEDYDFYYNKKKVVNEEEISTIIERIKKEYPHYYQKLHKEPFFRNIENKINQYKEKQKEIYIDKNDGITKIIPNKKEKLKEKFIVFGYALIEKEDGLYAKDLKTNEEYKIEYDNGYCYFEGIEESKFIFNPNINIVTPDKIIENNIVFKKENSHVRANQELTKFEITINNMLIYKIILEENNIVCNATNKNGKRIEMTDEEILFSISMEFPYLVEYIKNKTNIISNEKETIKKSQEEIEHSVARR